MGKIAYIQAAWHTEITNPAKEAFLTQICKRGYTAADVEFFSAPGALEIPLMAKKLAKTGKSVAVACSGLVVDGATDVSFASGVHLTGDLTVHATGTVEFHGDLLLDGGNFNSSIA